MSRSLAAALVACVVLAGAHAADAVDGPRSCSVTPTSTAIRCCSPTAATSGALRPPRHRDPVDRAPGVEVFGKFSPDGRWIAFTGQYDGDEQVYVIPAEGGEPRQLTFYPAHGPLTPRWGYDNQVYGWTPDGTRILFRSTRDETAAAR